MTKFKVTIKNITTVDELPDYWTDEDYLNLLELFDFPEAETVKKENRLEYLKMAISEFEPAESAAILLNYKLNDKLNEGQIDQISNDMLIDRISEEYPEIDLHEPLFHINQFLYKAYNGKFLNSLATIIGCEIISADGKLDPTDKELFLKILTGGLSDRNIIKRLFREQLDENTSLPEANDILWKIENKDNNQFKVTTSQYWINATDIENPKFETQIELQN
ncbi:hypothetical protein JKA74_01745 [Marivirga sp. S37H4]|uniref:Uncharacterized protein n=1 Tax=Marivirga aurantiaca TaxID=2802615 RepID=A0A935C8K0_9BACT|nr:hypothetical protein [Marivirga aurantiaca]MBK6263743.1 hypothetical protein [Marivirga aurantiaca]